MKIRSCVLVACMVVVPALALFSHLTPPAAREFLRCSVCDPLCQAISAIDAALPFGSAATPVTPAKAHQAAAVPAQAATAVAPQPLAGATLTEAAAPTSQAADHDLPRSQAEWAMLASIRKQLTDLGATSIDCRPQPGAVPGYTSTCRIGIDAAGQLHRMFHGQGPNAPAAMQSLIDQIQAWQAQQAGTPRQRF